MRLRIAIAAALLATSAAASPAKATLYDFTFAGPAAYGSFSGQFDVTGGTIMSITGTSTNFGNIIGVLPPSSFLSNDNQFSPTAPYFTFGGLSFGTSSGQSFNIFTNTAGVSRIDTLPRNPQTVALTIAPATVTVPEPASAMLLGAGLLGLAGLRRRSASLEQPPI